MEAIARVFELEQPIAPLVAVPGGQSHRMWRLSTTIGRYAVKELNRDFGNPAYLALYDRAFRIEMAALQAGLPMPRPVPVPGTERCWAELPDGGNRPTTVRVHEWVEGKAPSIRDEEIVVHAGAVGALLARIHALRLATDTTPADILTVYGEGHWRDLNGRVSSAGLPWA
ncbi:MAG: phosphotransferase, partial [Dehalococcoidia bacterium]